MPCGADVGKEFDDEGVGSSRSAFLAGALLEVGRSSVQSCSSRRSSARASEVFGASDQPGTVDTYVRYVRRKTDVDLITRVRGQDYRLGTP